MTRLALLACLVAGWSLMGRVVRERCLPVRLAGAVALGSLVATALTNAWLRLVPLDLAAPAVAASALALAGLGMAARPRPPRAAWPSLRPVEILVLGSTLVATAWYVFLAVVRHPDDDYFIHMANWGLLGAGLYPPVNPFMPDLPLRGHVARDLLVAWWAGGDPTPYPAVRLLSVVWQVSAAVLLYFGARRWGGGPLAACAALALAFFAAESGFPDFRSSALQVVIANNNPLVHAGLFLLMGLGIQACRRGGSARVALAGLALGAYALVYETHYVVLALALPLAAATLPTEDRRAQVARVLSVVLVAGALAVVQGGLLTDLAARLAGLSQAAGGAEVTQEVGLRGLRTPPLTLTSPNGVELPLLGFEFLAAQNLAWWLLPLAAPALALRANRFGWLGLWVGLVALAIPATLDLGRFNLEALRMVFLAGLGFAIATGCAAGEAARRLLAWLARSRPALAGPAGVVLLAGAAAVLSGASQQTLRVHRDVLWTARERPGAFCFSPREQAIQHATHPQFQEVDLEMVALLRDRAGRGDRVILNPARIPGLPSSADPVPAFQTTVAGLARLPVTGVGLRPDPETLDLNPFLVGYGYRGLAFWATLDPDLADDLGATWIYVLEENLAPGQREALAREPRYRVMERREGREGARRLLLQVHPGPRPPAEALPQVLQVEGPDLTAGPSQVLAVTLRVRNGGASPVRVHRGMVLEQVVADRDSGREVNQGDRVRTRLPEAVVPPGGDLRLEIPLVAPPRPGDYSWEVRDASRPEESWMPPRSLRVAQGM